MKLEKDSRNSLDFELFFKIHYSRFYSYALHVIGNEEEARDIVSDYFEFIWKHRASNIGNWETYAYSYIRNKCIDSLRHQDVTRKYVDFYIQLMKEEQHREEVFSDRYLQIKEALAELPDSIRQIVDKNFYEQKIYKEIALELGISESLVKKRMAKAMEFIKNRVVKKSK